MNQQMKLTGISLIAAAILSGSLVACTKKDNNNSDTEKQRPVAKNTTVEAAELKNTTTSEVLKLSEGQFAVLPPAVQMKGISVANEPVKGTCKQISKLEHDVKRLEAEQVKAVEMAEHDTSAEAAVDEIAAKIESKNQELQELLASTAPQVTTYDKAALFANLESLKSANPQAGFEIAEPQTAVLTIENSNRKASISQSIDLSKAKLMGSFRSQDRAVKMTLEVNYGILCSYRKISAGQERLFITLK